MIAKVEKDLEEFREKIKELKDSLKKHKKLKQCDMPSVLCPVIVDMFLITNENVCE